MYMSEATWTQLKALMGNEESMSATIRRSIQMAFDNKEKFDRVKNLEKLISALCEDED